MTGLRQSDRAFGLMFAAVFAVLAGVWWLLFDVVVIWAIGVAAAFGGVAILLPWLLLPLNRLWARFAHGLGRVSNFVLLGLFFYLFVLPMGLLLRAVGRDPTNRRPSGEATSYWTPVTRHASPETFPDLF